MITCPTRSPPPPRGLTERLIQRAASAMALECIPEPPNDLSVPPVVCTCPVHKTACSQLLTHLAQQFDALLTYLATITLPALFPRPSMATSSMVEYSAFTHPAAPGLQVVMGTGGFNSSRSRCTSLHQPSCAGRYQSPSLLLPDTPGQPPLLGLCLFPQFTNWKTAHPCSLGCSKRREGMGSIVRQTWFNSCICQFSEAPELPRALFSHL